MSFSWLHLSDMHFEFSNYSTSRMRSLLVDYLKKLNINFSFLVITGDITYRGGEYDNAYNYIKKISDELKIKLIYMVPGNHDLKRDDLRTTILEGITESGNVVEKVDNLDKSIYKILIKGQSKYFNFYKNVLKKDYVESNLHFIEQCEEYNIIHINTCLFAGRDGEEGKLLISRNELNNSICRIKESKVPNIAIGHHSIDCFSDVVRQSVINCMVDNNIDLYLCGHTHLPNAYFDMNNVNKFSMFVSGAGIAEKHAPPYFITGSFENGSIQIIYHKWNKNETWTIGNDVSRQYPNGIISFDISRFSKKTEMLKEFKDEASCTSSILNYEYLPRKSNSLPDNTKASVITNELTIYNFHCNSNKMIENYLKHSINTNTKGNYISTAPANLFQNNKKLFLEQLSSFINKNLSYTEVESCFKVLLLLGDRVLAAIKSHQEFGCIEEDIINLLYEFKEVTASNLYEKISGYLYLPEIWLKALLWLVYPYKYENIRYNTLDLQQIISNLELIEPTDNNLNFMSIINYSKVKELVLNYISNYESFMKCPNGSVFDFNDTLLSSILMIIIFPLLKLQKILINRLECLIIHPINTESIELLIKTVASERRGRLTNFGGRDEFIRTIKSKLEGYLRNTGGYLLITGGASTGKSALCAKFTEILTSETEAIGISTSSVKGIAPWLPNSIIHFGKQSKKPKEIVKLIVEQANTLLLNPINADTLEEKILNDYKSCESMRISSNHEFDLNLTNPIIEIRNKGERKIDLSKDTSLYNDSMSIDIKIYQRILYACLDRVVSERGSIILIIDALDEISIDGQDLGFLPPQLPVGASALLTSRPITKLINWFNNAFNIETIGIPPINRQEIPLITTIEDSTDNGGKDFNDKVYRKSSGWVFLIANAAKSLRENEGNLSLVKIDDDIDGILEGQASKWGSSNLQDNKDILREILYLLSIFEPVAPLKLSIVQDYLSFIGITLRLADLRQYLQFVSEQLEGLDAGMIKLSLEVFAKYIRDTYCSYKDLKMVLDIVINWLIVSDEVDIDLIVGFIGYWGNKSKVPDKRYCQIVDELIQKFIKDKQEKKLRKIGLGILFEVHNNELIIEIGIKSISSSAELGDNTAMYFWGKELLKGVNVGKDIDRGIEWIKKSAQNGISRAMVYLGKCLLDGKYVKKDVADGEKWLRKAIELNNKEAMRELGVRLIYGETIEKNTQQGEELLRKSASSGLECAICELGFYLIKKGNWEETKDEVEKLFQTLTNLDIDCFKEKYGSLLIDSNFLEKNVKKGEKLLRNSAENGNTIAMKNLGMRLLDGNGLKRNVEEGGKWLRKSVELNDSDAMVELGKRLLDGNGLPKNIEEGKMWLRKSINMGEKCAICKLAFYLFDNGNSEEIKEAQRLLQSIIDLNIECALMEYGIRLIDGNSLEKDIDKGEEIFIKLSEAGNVIAMRTLGKRILDGKVHNKNIDEGEMWLRKSADLGDINAAVELCKQLINGNVKEKNIGETEIWIDKVLKCNEINLITNLGYELYSHREYKWASECFYNAFLGGGDNAGVNLCYMIRRNEVPKDANINSVSIKDLLKQSLSNMEPFAVINYVLCLAQGIEYPEDWKLADSLILSLENIGRAINWWKKLCISNDPEGHLIVGWLSRHRLCDDPDGMSVIERLKLAQNRGWRVPNWMLAEGG